MRLLSSTFSLSSFHPKGFVHFFLCCTDKFPEKGRQRVALVKTNKISGFGLCVMPNCKMSRFYWSKSDFNNSAMKLDISVLLQYFVNRKGGGSKTLHKKTPSKEAKRFLRGRDRVCGDTVLYGEMGFVPPNVTFRVTAATFPAKQKTDKTVPVPTAG